MSRNVLREFMTQSVLVLGACIGGWMLLVEPRQKEIATLEQAIAEHASKPKSVEQETIDKAVERVAKIKTRVAQIESFNTLASDSPRLYGLMMELAGAHGVDLKGLQPTASDPRAAQRDFMSTRIDLTLEGKYANLAQFMQALNSLDGFIRMTSLQVSPMQDEMLIARCGVEVLSFKVDNTLANVGAPAGTASRTAASATHTVAEASGATP